MREDWTLLKKLIWLRRAVGGGVVPILKTITGSLLHITDALAKPAHELVAVLKPVQDLHGYDAPWPAGGGKNKLKTAGLTYAAPSNTNYSNTTKRTFTQDTYTLYVASNNYYSNTVTATAIISENSVELTSSSASYGCAIPVIGLAAGETYTFSASSTTGRLFASFYDSDGTFISGSGAPTATKTVMTFTVPENTYYTLLGFNVLESDTTATFTNIQLELGSSATAYAPYENICPITGWTGANVERYGKNLFNKNDPNMIRGLYFNRNGTTTASFSYAISYVPINPGDELVYSGLKGANENPFGIQFFDANKTFLAMGNPDVQRNNAAVTAPSGAAYIGISVFCASNAQYKDIDTAQLEIGTVASEYEPYQGTTLPINWQSSAGTIYGGTLTLNEDGSADLVKKWGIANLGSLNWTFMSGQNCFESDYVYGILNTYNVVTIMCDCYQAISNRTTSAIDKAIWLNSSSGDVRSYFRVNDTDYGTDAAAFKLAMSGHYVVYRLPSSRYTTYHFDNIGQLVLFLGENNIWVDASDDLTLTYYADGNASDAEALNTLLGGAYTPGDVSDKDALDILLGN